MNNEATVGIVGGGKGGSEILKLFSEMSAFSVVFVSDLNNSAPAMRAARDLGIPTSTSIETILRTTSADFIIEATGSRSVFEKIRDSVHESTEILGSRAAMFMFNMLNENRRLANESVKMEIGAIQKEIVAETRHVSDLVQDINDLTVGMKILSLNAGVEAARAGDHGKGFAMVAGEIKNVSEKAKTLALSIEVINRSIADISSRIDESIRKLD